MASTSSGYSLKDAAAPADGEDALGDPAAEGLHSDPDAGSSRGQRLLGSQGQGTVPLWVLAGAAVAAGWCGAEAAG